MAAAGGGGWNKKAPGSKKAGKGASAMDENARLPLILTMLQPPAAAAVVTADETPAELLAVQQRTEQFLRQKIQRNEALMYDLHMKWQLQKEAIRALPTELRRACEQSDLGAFPPARNLYFDTAPESYRD